jgi:hypothetical protein
MGRLKTFLFVLLAGLGPLPPAALAFAPAPEGLDQVRFFATCAGELSALVEHQWMFDGLASETTMHRRAEVYEILQAVMPKGQGRTVLGWQIEAKVAYRALLTRATLGPQDRGAVAAMQRAEVLLGQCNAMLLG